MNEQSFFMLADAGKCTGCRACELACFAGHGHLEKNGTVGTVTSPVIPRLFLARGAASRMPIQCHHCEDAPCLRSCLTGAIVREEGVVRINERSCIGCRNCAISCPFGAIEIFSLADVPQKGKNAPELAYKCDLCTGEKEPACAAACPNEALRLVDPQAELQAKRIIAVNAEEPLQRGEGGIR